MYFTYDNEFNSVDKVLYLVERMNHSDGVKKAVLKSGKT